MCTVFPDGGSRRPCFAAPSLTSLTRLPTPPFITAGRRLSSVDTRLAIPRYIPLLSPFPSHLAIEARYSNAEVGTAARNIAELIRATQVHSIADVGYILAGRFGKEFLGAIYMACALFPRRGSAFDAKKLTSSAFQT